MVSGDPEEYTIQPPCKVTIWVEKQNQTKGISIQGYSALPFYFGGF